ncbi:glycosyltransferase family 1 [Actinomycetes bacterium]|nr:glycosyltransferase family 1 [Actinomycetes bacterium]
MVKSKVVKKTSKPRVLHVIARMNVGGTAVYLSNLVTGLTDLGLENLLVIGNVPKGEVEDGVVVNLPIARIGSMSRSLNFANDRAAKRELDAIIKTFKPDLIHSHTFKAGLLVRISNKSVPVVHTFHGHHLYDPEFGTVKRSVLNLIEKRLAVKADAIVTIGENVKKELLAVGIGKAAQYVSIAPGIDGVKLSSKVKVLKSFSLEKEKRPIVMWLGRFTQVKRPDRVVALAKKSPDLFFVMAGGGEMVDSIRRSAPSNLKVIGWQKKEDMWSIADIALCTSDSEGMPLSLIEAQLAGIPVVSTNVGSVNEIVVDSVTGKLGNSDNELLAGFKWVIAARKTLVKRSALKRKIKTLAHQKFEKKTMATAHRELYRKLGV